MKTKKVISRLNIPSTLPLYSTITVALALDYWNATEWVIGAVGVIFIVFWISSIKNIIIEKDIDIFNETSITKKSFKDKLKEKMNEENNKKS